MVAGRRAGLHREFTEGTMHTQTARCDCCGTGAEACGLDVLRAAGWMVVEHAAGEKLVLLCAVCAWQRNRAQEAVTLAVESAYGSREVSGVSQGHLVRRRMGWFWA